MNEEIKKQIQVILADLDSKIRQEIKNWWNDVRHSRPESLPWFSNGLRGFLRKLYYNNNPDNPDWQNYKVESKRKNKISLSEYISIKNELQFALTENAPTGAEDIIGSLINKLMPLIQGAIEKISSLGVSIATPEPSKQEPEKSEPVVNPPKQEPEQQNPGTTNQVPPVPPQPVVNSEPPKQEPEPEAERSAPKKKENPLEVGPDVTPKNEPSKVDDVETEEIPKDENDAIFKNLLDYSSSKDATSLTRKLSTIGIPVSKVRGKLVIDAKKSEKPADEVAASLWTLMDYLSSKPENELVQIGLNKEELRTVDMDFWFRLTKGSPDLFMGIKLSKELIPALSNYIKNNAYEEQIKRYKRMLAENRKEDRDIVISKRLKPKERKKYLIEAIKQR